MNKIIEIVLDEVGESDSKDTGEFSAFLKVNTKPFCLIRMTDSNDFFIHFISNLGYQFSLSTQKRADRKSGIRFFKSIESAFNDTKKYDYDSVIFVSEKTKLRIFKGLLVIGK